MKKRVLVLCTAKILIGYGAVSCHVMCHAEDIEDVSEGTPCSRGWWVVVLSAE
jgi:hypothetical protein